MTRWIRCFGLSLVVAAGAANAQQALPKEISGRYYFPGTTVTQVFSLQEITQDADKSFKAKLTWWARDSRCSLKDEPIVGRITATGIAFDAKSKCDVPFTAELNRAEKGWTGKAVNTAGTPITLELQAN